MNDRQFLEILSKEKAEGAFLLLGPESHTRHRLIAAAFQALLPEGTREFNFMRLSGGETDPRVIAAQVSSHPFMSARRVVHITGLDEWPAGKDEAFIAALQKRAATTVLLLEASQLDRRRKLGDWLTRSCTVVECPALKEAEAASWIEGQLKSRGVTSESGVASEIARRVGTDLNMLTAEIEKLVLYCGAAGRVTRQDCESVISSRPEEQVFGLLDAVGARDLRGSLKALNDLLEAGQAEALILYMITRQMRNIYLARFMTERGTSPGEIGKALNLRFDFQVRKLMEQTRAFSENELRAALRRLREGDETIKTGSREPRVELDLVLSDLCLPGRLH